MAHVARGPAAKRPSGSRALGERTTVATPDADIVDYLAAQYSVERLVLRPELAVHLPVSGVTDGTVLVAMAAARPGSLVGHVTGGAMFLS
jgi:hypothetical protein